MSDHPNLNDYGYQIETQLGRNREGGRITWKGIKLDTQTEVVIKQFCFAIADSTWSGYKAYEQELKILQNLDHNRIPKYIDAVETKDGFCLIQKYIFASNLSNYRTLTLAEIQQIALKILEVLIYLQQQNPPILHRDLKPENILVDENLEVYLIDFGFASLGSKETSASSVFKGTPGFIAPEQIVKPTLASDLYSLGVTLVCLLSNKSINEIQNLASTDDPYQLNIKALLPDLDRQFVGWLKKMTNPKASKRFKDAVAARDALLAIANDNYDIVLADDSQLASVATSQIAVGALFIGGLSTVAVWGINYIDHHLESTVIDIAIAIISAIVIGITQLGAVEIARTDPQARLPGGILGIGTPILLVSASGLIWGIGEAVDISAMTAIAEIFVLSYFWWQIPMGKNLKIGFLISAIAVGIAFGLKIV